MKAKIFLLFILTTLVFSCKKKTPDKPVLNSEKELLDFKLEANLNSAALSQTITAEIDSSVIKLTIPDTVPDTVKLIATFSFKGVAVFVNDIAQESGVTPNNFFKPLTYIVQAEDGSTKDYVVKVTRSTRPAVLPHIYINTDGNASISKEDYVDADIRIDGMGVYADYEGRTGITGRGNSTWSYPKKPYKLKLDEKAPLFGMGAEKKWILLANYLDGTLLMNAIPYETADMLGLPYVNHIVPVQLTLNGEDQGFYVFTEHKEVKPDRIAVGEGGLLLEFDSYYDEEPKFKSDLYHLPIMLKYPELEDSSETAAQNALNQIKSDFNAFEALVYASAFPDNDYKDYFDIEAYVNYMIVDLLTDNEEINHPKSTYMNKKAGGKYWMGIVWDFDWGFGYETNHNHFDPATADNYLFGTSVGQPGNLFFQRFLKDPAVTALLKSRWQWFRSHKFEALKEHVKKYAESVRMVYEKDHEKWTKRDSSGNLDTDLQRVLDWLDARAGYLDTYIAGL